MQHKTITVNADLLVGMLEAGMIDNRTLGYLLRIMLETDFDNHLLQSPQELADSLGVHKHTICRILNNLEGIGVIQMDEEGNKFIPTILCKIDVEGRWDIDG